MKARLLAGTLLLAAWLASPPVKARQASPACATIADAPASAWQVKVPLEVFDGRAYVQAKVNGRGPFRFAVDTGASGIGRADASLVSALDLPVQAQALNSDGVATASADQVRLDTLQLDRLVRTGVKAITRDYSGNKPAGERFSGILGRAFFGDGLLVIDYPRRTLYFSPSLRLPPADGQVFRYERAFRVPVSIAGLATTGNLDTGANVALVMPRALYEQASATPLQAAGPADLSNSTLSTGRGQLRGPVRIGGITATDVAVRVPERYPELLVGAHFLQDLVVMIDQPSRLVALCR